MGAPRAKYRTTLALAAGLLAAGCATPPPRGEPLGVIDNILSHEGPPPPSPPIVRELLAEPLEAMDARAIFERTVPEALRKLAEPPRRDLERGVAPGDRRLARRHARAGEARPGLVRRRGRRHRGAGAGIRVDTPGRSGVERRAGRGGDRHRRGGGPLRAVPASRHHRQWQDRGVPARRGARVAPRAMAEEDSTIQKTQERLECAAGF